QNGWNVWLYPKDLHSEPGGEFVTVSELNSHALETLENGGTVLLQIPKNRVRGDEEGQVKLGFSSIFWNTAWTRGQAPHTLGILCNPKHPALSAFPTDFHSDWLWWYVITNSAAMILDGLPPELRPIVQVVDDWFQARRLGLVFEARVGKGRLVVSSIDLDADNPVVSQLRKSLYDYLSEKPGQLVEVDVEDIRLLYE
ncbi:MAG: beta-galactosidase, partial [Verrucomicrobiae bacterium]|nr:beta-galactosidase [Verrucomicrobiae bacterium]